VTRRAALFLVLLAVAFGGVLAAPRYLVNPGTVSSGHAKIASDCFACHTPFLGPDDAKCMACHKPAEIRTRKPGGVAFHEHLAEKSCTACHTEHLGAKAPKSIHAFRHELLAPAMRTACHDCHRRPPDALHREIVKGCGSCHTQDAWKPATFDHGRYFRFDRHHPPKCLSCHLDGVYQRYSCYGSCHEHSESKVRREHREEGIRDIANCTECHRSGDSDEAERIWKQKRRLERGR
jgi:hypothetical protein